jgi:hypothetical protein
MGYLLFWGAPLAVSRLIVSVLIRPTVERFPKRTFPHIGQEIFKAIKPSSTYRNSSSSVIVPMLDFIVRASSFHRHPAFICSGKALSVRFRLRVFFSFAEASATDGVSSKQGAAPNDAFRAAITADGPHRFAFFGMRKAQDDKATKTLISDIFAVGHSGSFHERLRQGAASVVALRRPAFYGTGVGCWLWSARLKPMAPS